MPPAKSEGSSQPAPNGSNDNKSVGDTNSTNSSSAGPAIVKQKITKSRNGCLTCKKKRLKCDETKPACLNCQKKNIECGGYATNFKWRSFNDAGSDYSGGGGGVMLMSNSSQSSLNSMTPVSSSASPANNKIINSTSLNSNNDNDSITMEKSSSTTSSTSSRKRKYSTTEEDKSSKDSFRKHLELASISMTGKSMKDIKIENDLISKGLNPQSYKRKSITNLTEREVWNKPTNAKLKRSGSDSRRKSEDENNSQRSYSINSSGIPPEVFTIREDAKVNRLESLADVAVDEIKRSPSVVSKEIYTRGNNNLSPFNQIPFSPNFTDFMRHEDNKTKEEFDINLTPSLSAIINFAVNMDESGAIDSKLIKFPMDGPLSPMNLNNPSQSDSNYHQNNFQNNPNHITNSNHDAQTHSQTRSETSEPSSSTSDFDSLTKISMMSDSGTPFSLPQQTPVPDSGPSHRSLMKTSEQEQIIHLYSQYTCSIMSIKNGAHENPWRSMIVPLASKYNCLFNSIACMTLFHLAGSSQFSDTIGDLRAKGYMYMKRCILELASGLSRMNSNGDSESVYELPADIALTTCLNLAVSESWDTHITSGIAHLKGAKSMIQKVLTLLRDQQQMIHTKKPTSKKIEMDSPNGETTDFAHSELIKSKRIDLKRKLVLVEEAEWDSMFNEKSDFSKMFDKGTTNNSIPIPKSLQFLFNIWIYFEVLAQMTTDTNYDDKGIDLVATITTMLQSAQKQRDEEKSNQLQHIANAAANANETSDLQSESASSVKSDVPTESSFAASMGGINDARFNFFDNFETFSYNTDYIDPLLGCGQSLFSIMGKVANLIAKIRKIKRNEKWKGNGRNSLTTITLATELKRQLIEWKPTITAEMINQAGMYEDNTNRSMWDIPSCIATAEAYRFATLLYLHQAVPEIPSSGSHQLAEKIFILLASIPTNSDLHTILIFPLLVSSCEAEAGEEREWCEDRWSLLSQKLWIGNIDRAFEVVKEVWKRKNEYIQKMKSDVRNNSGNNAGGSGSGRSKGNEDEELRNISVQISGLMAVINNDQNATPIDDIKGGITSRLHWSTVMKEWGWEVLLG